MTLWPTLRVAHLLECFSSFYAVGSHPVLRGRVGGGFDEPAHLLGYLPTAARGGYLYSDEQGAQIAVRWDERGIVGLVFDKDSSRNEAAAGHLQPREYRPLRWLVDLPSTLSPLADDVAGWMHDLSTAGFWGDGGPDIHCSSGSSVDTWDWCHLLDGVRGQLNRLEVLSLEPAHGALALALATASLHGSHTLTATEEAVLLAAPDVWDEFEPTEQAVEQLRGALSELNIVWAQ